MAKPSSEMTTIGTNMSTVWNERAARVIRSPSPSPGWIISLRKTTMQAMTTAMRTPTSMPGNGAVIGGEQDREDRVDQHQRDARCMVEAEDQQQRRVKRDLGDRREEADQRLEDTPGETRLRGGDADE